MKRSNSSRMIGIVAREKPHDQACVRDAFHASKNSALGTLPKSGTCGTIGRRLSFAFIASDQVFRCEAMPGFRGGPSALCQPFQRQDKHSGTFGKMQAARHGHHAVCDGAGEQRRQGTVHAYFLQHPPALGKSSGLTERSRSCEDWRRPLSSTIQ